MPSLTATPAPLPRAAGQAVFGVFVLFVAAGIVRRALDDLPLAIVGGGIALGFGAAAILGPRRYLVPAVSFATAGVVVLGNGTSSSVVWFGLPVLAAWCALSAPLWVAGGYWAAAVVVLACEAIFATHDAGWAA